MVVITPELAVDVMPAQLEFHALAEFIKQRVLGFGRKFGKHKVAFRLPLAPDMLESAGVESGERHEILRIQGLLRVIEVTLRILQARVLLTFLEHLAGLDTRQADFLLDAGDHHDQAFFHKVVPGTGEYQDFLQYLTVVVGVSYYYCHSKYFY